MIDCMAAMDPGLNFAVYLGGGAKTLRPKSDHCSMSRIGILRAFVTLSAFSRPPVIYAAPIMASATSAIAFTRNYSILESPREGNASPYPLTTACLLTVFVFFFSALGLPRLLSVLLPVTTSAPELWL